MGKGIDFQFSKVGEPFHDCIDQASIPPDLYVKSERFRILVEFFKFADRADPVILNFRSWMTMQRSARKDRDEYKEEPANE